MAHITAVRALALYLSTVLAVIVPSMGVQRRVAITNDIAVVTISEERAFENDENGQQTALMLVSLAHYETGYSWSAWIDDGRCNEPVWRQMHAEWIKVGGCDNAKAWGMWQVHAPGDDLAIGRSYVTNRKNGIRSALFIARKSLQTGTGLCGYTGETYPNCPMAKRRLGTSRAWAERFPFEAPLAMR